MDWFGSLQKPRNRQNHDLDELVISDQGVFLVFVFFKILFGDWRDKHWG